MIEKSILVKSFIWKELSPDPPLDFGLKQAHWSVPLTPDSEQGQGGDLWLFFAVLRYLGRFREWKYVMEMVEFHCYLHEILKTIDKL